MKSISHSDPPQSRIRHTQFNKCNLATEYMHINKFLKLLEEPDDFGSGINILDPV